MVKCSECGFLAFRGREDFQLVETPDVIRDGERVPAHLYPMPFCFQRVLDFRDQYGWGKGAGGIGDTAIWPAIQAERECDAYTPWQQGFSPKEHREMLDRERMLKRQDEIMQTVWKREDERDKRVNDQHKEQMDTLRGQHRQQLLIFGLAVIAATLLGAMIQAGWIDRPW